jgi:Suppressor of fused protein (SUFU)
MKVSNSRVYIDSLQRHYEDYFGLSGTKMTLDHGPTEKLHPDFFVVEFLPNERHKSYCTVGMSADRQDNSLIELVVYAPRASTKLVELLTICASYHRNHLPLNLHHTVNIGQPWLDGSKCDHAFISLPYLDEQEFELLNIGDSEIHCYWLIPITEKERDFKIKNGYEALEDLFEEKQFNYLDPGRNSLVN